MKRFESLRSEKAVYSAEIPESKVNYIWLIFKKETDRYKEEYDQIVKKDKELEKLFRKEFGVFESHFDVLFKLYKLRNRV